MGILTLQTEDGGSVSYSTSGMVRSCEPVALAKKSIRNLQLCSGELLRKAVQGCTAGSCCAGMNC